MLLEADVVSIAGILEVENERNWGQSLEHTEIYWESSPSGYSFESWQSKGGDPFKIASSSRPIPLVWVLNRHYCQPADTVVDKACALVGLNLDTTMRCNNTRFAFEKPKP